MRAHEPSDFLAKLSTDDLPDPREVAVVGLAKANEGSSSVIDFTTSTACGGWLPLPIEIVDSVTHLANVTCKDHEHPLVKVTFKRRNGTKDEVAVLLDLVSQLQTTLARARSEARSRAAIGKLSANASPSDCAIVDLPGGLQICCVVTKPDGSLEVECGGIV
jgi:hypothetical protein